MIAAMRLVARGALFVPPLLVILVVVFFAVDTPWYDEWDLTDTLIAARAGTLTPSQLWEQHTGHRFVLPKVLFIALYSPFGWHPVAAMLTSVAFAIATFAVVAYLLRWTIDDSSKRSALLLLSSVVLFSLNQYENWMWGWQLSWFMANFFVVAAIATAYRRGATPLGFASAALLAVAATFSAAAGLASWLAVAPIFIKRPWRLAAWAGIAMLTVSLYFIGFQRYVIAEQTYSLSFLSNALPFILTIAGAPVARFVAAALSIGAVLLLFLVFMLIRRRNAAVSLPWIGFMTYVFVFGLMTAVGRVAMGIEQALASRYTTPAALIVIGATALVVQTARSQKSARAVVLLAAALFIGTLPLLPYVADASEGRRVSRMAVQTYPLTRGRAMRIDTYWENSTVSTEKACAARLIHCPPPIAAQVRYVENIESTEVRSPAGARTASEISGSGLDGGVVFAVDRADRLALAAAIPRGNPPEWKLLLKSERPIDIWWFRPSNETYYEIRPLSEVRRRGQTQWP